MAIFKIKVPIALIKIVQYLVSILRNGLAGYPEVETSYPMDYSVVYWLLHAMSVENAAPDAEAMNSKLWDCCMKFLLANNEFQAWKTACPNCEWEHDSYCMYFDWKRKLMTPLHVASLYGLTRLTELLLDKAEHSDIPAAPEGGETPLHLAAHETVVRLLIEKGADVLAATEDGQTPLHFASKRGHVTSARLLIEKGADVLAATKDGKTPLQIAAVAGQAAAELLPWPFGPHVAG